MESSSIIYTSPSFNRDSSNNIADIADRVVDQFLTENGFHNDGVFNFTGGDNPAEIGEGASDEVNTNTHTETVNQSEEDEHEFEFPVICGDFNSCSISSGEFVSDEISPRYPLFDRSLLSDVDLDLCNDVVASLKTDSRSKRSPATRSSLMKLFADDRDAVSTSSSEAETDDLDGITPGTYCVWKPKTEPPGKHKKSNSISTGNISNRWKVRDLLKRSYSDDNYSSGKDSPVLLFIPPISPISPPISPNRKVKNEKVNKIDRTGTGKVDSTTVGGGVASTNKTEKKIPAYKTKIGNIRLPPYLPYRQDQIAAFANFNGGKRDLYRY
ncbi:hypothetical protein SSX86_010308 [Deinandra increscens subsp. villosa]|uniref:Uncharacterized protein n=1 Tax=Deinandra increscens subsp. villosa TaxID=3103831 RepID=A0AAP0D7B1_9ASTR